MVANKRVSKERGKRARAHPSAVLSRIASSPLYVSERRALMRADAVLRCVAVALEYDGWTSDEPDYAEAMEWPATDFAVDRATGVAFRFIDYGICPLELGKFDINWGALVCFGKRHDTLGARAQQ